MFSLSIFFLSDIDKRIIEKKLENDYYDNGIALSFTLSLASIIHGLLETRSSTISAWLQIAAR